MNAVDKLFSKEIRNEKYEQLFQRREKLRELLSKENKAYEIELRERRKYHGKDFKAMQQRVDDLQAEKEAHRKQLAQEKLHDHWRKNEPRLREIEYERNKKYVTSRWKDQVAEKEQVVELAKEQDRKLDKILKLQNEAALEEEKRKVEETALKNKILADELKQQMALLHRKEEESKMLKAEEEKLRHHNEALLESEKIRKDFENQRKKREFGRILIRQYKQQLKQRSKEVQEALKFDLKILAEIAEKEKKEELIKSARREKIKADAEYMHQVVADQLRLEKTREAELDMLFQEEASRQWRKRESEWERERLAREKLMKSVFEERQQQIEAKMEHIRAKQQETIEERELLLQQMEEHQLLTHRKENEKLTKRRQREEEIQEQITARETERERQKRKEKEESERARFEEEQYEDMLAQEATRLNVDTYSPPVSFRRKKVAFL
ncbi:trichoplein keratin filament-binding protein-like isoform X2 [Hydractinia symbiolongicarpus]|nr:trichoplein keratin filament-binding protein-like isoform X2 [Hydractinia symbiolongicarpus]